MELVCLTNVPFMAGVATAKLAEVPQFTEDCVGAIFLDDPWWGVMPLTVEPYVAATYAAYTVALPPAWGQIMFNGACSAFKCGTALWWGKLMAYVIPKGSKVLVS